jgi:hypothetical protein
MDKKSPYATLREAAEYLRISYSAATKPDGWVTWRERYGVRVSKIGRKLVIPYVDLDKMLSQMEIN